MNPVENLWREFKLNVQKRHTKNIAEVRVICMEEENKISIESCIRLVVNYKKRLDAVIANNGHATKY